MIHCRRPSRLTCTLRHDASDTAVRLTSGVEVAISAWEGATFLEYLAYRAEDHGHRCGLIRPTQRTTAETEPHWCT